MNRGLFLESVATSGTALVPLHEYFADAQATARLFGAKAIRKTQAALRFSALAKLNFFNDKKWEVHLKKCNEVVPGKRYT
jgi:hypothetical protein